MAKVILLGNSGAERFDAKVQKWLWIFMGILFLIQGGLNYYRESDWIVDKAMVNLMLFSGLFAFIYAWTNFSKKSKFAPKLKLDDTLIALKGSLFKKNKVLKWADIKSITFKPFRIDFKTDETVEVISYECTSDISIDIKESIRAVAEKKDIDVIAG